MTPDVDFFAELEHTIQHELSEAEDADHQLPVEPDGAVRRAAVLREDRRARHASTASTSCTISPTPTSRSTAGRRRRSCRCRARATSPSSSSRCRRATTWRAGASASWSATRTSSTRSARIKGYHDYGTFTPIQVAAIAALEGPQDCVARDRAQVPERGATCWSRGCTRPAGWSTSRRRRCTCGRRFPRPIAQRGSLEFTKQLLAQGEGLGVAGHRLRRVRRRARALRDDRERERARGRRSAASSRCSARTDAR